MALGLIGPACAPRETLQHPAPEPYEGQVTLDALRKAAGFGRLKFLKALAEVKLLRNGEPAGSLSGVFGYQAPDSLKAEFFGPLGITVMELLLSKDLLQVYLPQKELLYEMRLPGRMLSAAEDGPFRYRMEDCDGFYCLSAEGPGEGGERFVLNYYFDRTYLLNRRIVLGRAGEELVRIDFGQFGGRMAEKMILSFRNSLQMQLSLKESEFDTDIPADYFSPVPHAGNRLLPLEVLIDQPDPLRLRSGGEPAPPQG